jgi:arylformamidase
MRIIDISRSLSLRTSHWADDTTFEFNLPFSRKAGAKINVGAIRCSTHFATHVDAPFHFNGSTTVELLPLDSFFGEAEVIDSRFSERISFNVIKQMPPRILFRTDGWPDSNNFPASIPTLTELAIENLKRAGVRLIGVDLPSVDQIESKELPNHIALERAGITIVESLYLIGVNAGRYTFAGFPLTIEGGDAAPTRAVLIA